MFTTVPGVLVLLLFVDPVTEFVPEDPLTVDEPEPVALVLAPLVPTAGAEILNISLHFAVILALHSSHCLVPNKYHTKHTQIKKRPILGTHHTTLHILCRIWG